MAKEAEGHWPPNVSAVIISPEEKRARLAQSPPGGQTVVSSVGAQTVQGAPHASIETKYIIPNVESRKMTEQSQTNVDQETESGVFYGKQAITLAVRMGIGIVWLTSDKSPIDITNAQQLIATQGPQAVCFDFDLLEQLPEPDEEETDPGFDESAIMAELNPPPTVPPSVAMPDTPATQALAADMQHSATQPQQDPISEREKLAWGGVLSTPGQTVYFRPNVVRVEVEGNVKVQKGIKGNVRMMRITRVNPQGETVQLANAVQTRVIPPQVGSPNPPVVYRQTQPATSVTDKIPVPKPQVPVPGTNQTEENPDFFDEQDF